MKRIDGVLRRHQVCVNEACGPMGMHEREMRPFLLVEVDEGDRMRAGIAVDEQVAIVPLCELQELLRRVGGAL